MKGVALGLMVVYVVGAIAAARLPECWRSQKERPFPAEQIPLLVMIIPPLALLVWPVHIATGCPTEKYEDDR